MSSLTVHPKQKCLDPGCSAKGDYKDGFCKSHWDFLLGGMTNHQRMQAKKALREARRALNEPRAV